MEYAVYESGRNYLVCELRGGNPVKGLLCDKGNGSLESDIASFSTGDVRIGSSKLGMMAAARLAAKSRFVARVRGGDIVEMAADASDDARWSEYAGI